MNESAFLTEGELLKALNITADRTAVWRWRKQGMPFVKIGRSPHYDLSAVKEWFEHQANITARWNWAVWSWVPESTTPEGVPEPAIWYEECRCRNERDAENIAKLVRTAQPWMVVRVSITKPKEPPTEQAQPESSPPGGTSHE